MDQGSSAQPKKLVLKWVWNVWLKHIWNMFRMSDLDIFRNMFEIFVFQTYFSKYIWFKIYLEICLEQIWNMFRNIFEDKPICIETHFETCFKCRIQTYFDWNMFQTDLSSNLFWSKYVQNMFDSNLFAAKSISNIVEAE